MPTLADELTTEVDKLHALMHDQQGRGMWAWWVCVKNSIDRINKLTGGGDNEEQPDEY